MINVRPFLVYVFALSCWPNRSMMDGFNFMPTVPDFGIFFCRFWSTILEEDSF
jgi:hypothetical protein